MKSASPKVKTASANHSEKERMETKIRSKKSAAIRRVRTPASAAAGSWGGATTGKADPSKQLLSLIFALLPHCCLTGAARRCRAARVTGRRAVDDDVAMTTRANKRRGCKSETGRFNAPPDPKVTPCYAQTR